MTVDSFVSWEREIRTIYFSSQPLTFGRVRSIEKNSNPKSILQPREGPRAGGAGEREHRHLPPLAGGRRAVGPHQLPPPRPRQAQAVHQMHDTGGPGVQLILICNLNCLGSLHIHQTNQSGLYCNHDNTYYNCAPSTPLLCGDCLE